MKPGQKNDIDKHGNQGKERGKEKEKDKEKGKERRMGCWNYTEPPNETCVAVNRPGHHDGSNSLNHNIDQRSNNFSYGAQILYIPHTMVCVLNVLGTFSLFQYSPLIFKTSSTQSWKVLIAFLFFRFCFDFIL